MAIRTCSPGWPPESACDPSEYTFRTSVTIETADPELAWVNDGVFIAVGGRRPSRVSYDVYLVA